VEIYSALVVDRTTNACLLEFHDTREHPNMRHSDFTIQFAYTIVKITIAYQINFRTHKSMYLVPLRYLKIIFHCS